MDELQKRPWGVKGVSCEHAGYMNLAAAVVVQARADVLTGAEVFAAGVGCLTGELMHRAALSWRWLSDPSIKCSRLSFREVCDGCGVEFDVALDGVDEMAEGFPSGFTRHLAWVIELVELREAERKKRAARKQKGKVSGG